MHDLAAERILVHFATYYGEGEGVRALIRGSDGRPGRQVFPLSSSALPLWRSELCAVVAESASTTSATIALANVTSAGALMPERPGKPNRLLVMVLIVMGVPPLSMVGRHETATNMLLLAAGIA